MFHKQMQMLSYNPKTHINSLHLGCGTIVHPAFDNVDKYNVDKRIITQDLFTDNWKLPLNHYNYIYSNHFFEHIPHGDELYNVMDNIRKVSINGCILELRVPYPRLKSLISADHHRIIDIKTFSPWIIKKSTCHYKFIKKFLTFQYRMPWGNYHFKKYLNMNIPPFYALTLIFQINK